MILQRVRMPTPIECFEPGLRTVTSVTPRSYSSQRSSRLIWRVERSRASNTARSPSTSEILGMSAVGSDEPARVVGDLALAYRVHTSTSPSYGSYVSISWSMIARIAISSDASATMSSPS